MRPKCLRETTWESLSSGKSGSNNELYSYAYAYGLAQLYRLGSRQVFVEDKIGTLEVWKKADIAIRDRDLYSIPTDHVKDLKCLMTLVYGKVAQVSPDSPVRGEPH